MAVPDSIGRVLEALEESQGAKEWFQRLADHIDKMEKEAGAKAASKESSWVADWNRLIAERDGLQSDVWKLERELCEIRERHAEVCTERDKYQKALGAIRDAIDVARGNDPEEWVDD